MGFGINDKTDTLIAWNMLEATSKNIEDFGFHEIYLGQPWLDTN